MYHRYGLTDDEKKTHLQQYNHALFQNSLSFMDIIWEINLLYNTVVILEDKDEPAINRAEFNYDSFYADCLKSRVPPAEAALFRQHMSYGKLDQLKEEASFYIHLRSGDSGWVLHRVVLTPAFDPQGTLYCVYVGGLRLNRAGTASKTLPSRAMFQDALLSNSYFHFDMDLTDGGLIWDDFVDSDGNHPIRDATGMEAPVPYNLFLSKWYELYEPQFERQQVQNIFSMENFLRCYAQGERFLNVEVKQKDPYTGQLAYMHILVLLLEDPDNQHVHACIIWHRISEFRSRSIEAHMRLQNDNEALKRTVGYDEQFRRAALSGSMMVYNINLTRNLIEDEFYEIVDGSSYPMLQLVGLTAPCRFDTFCEKWAEAKVPEDSKETFRKLYNRQYLLDAYARCEYQLEIEFDTVIGRGIPVTLRNTILLTKDNDSGDILAMVNGKDVTAQRMEDREKRRALQAAYDAANRANAAKSDFLARMSHDIRTPMNAIVGMNAIASAHLDDRERVQDCLNKIDIASRHLLGLINDVLDMSKIESGKIELQEEAFSLSDLVDTLLEMCRPQIAEREHTLKVTLKEITHEQVIGDSQHLQQAFMNLMSNAIKYTPNGGIISLSISEKVTNRPNVGCYEFIFEDNGIGMSEEFQKHLFDPFERAEDARAQKEQGTGLGMSIARNIVQMMNGSIEVKSALNKGTRFTATVFLRLQDEAASPVYKDYPNLPILIADDDRISGETSCEILSQLGMRATWVSSGQEAIDMLLASYAASEDYFAIILDWRMPGMDGLATAREIRRLMGKSIPIVIQSAYDWSDIEHEARAAGVNGFISKPLFKSRMACLLDELLGQKEDKPETDALEELKTEDFTGKRALMAEDNDLNAEIAEEIFGMLGLTIERVCNGREAVERMKAVSDGYYDIIFMDIQMPVMNGHEAAKAIRALDRPYAKNIPILALSANAFAEDVMESKASGMNDHIAKPLDFDQLHSALKRWIK